MNTLYQNQAKILIALDCIIFGFDGEKLNLLIVRRVLEPEKDKWSLMGDFVKQEESLDEAAERILFQRTGLKDVFMEQVYTFGEVYRDPGERTISVTYYALIDVASHDHELSRQFDAHWVPINEMPELIFDHSQMVQQAKERLQYKAAFHPVGFELLPEKFTLPQLQRLYEAIYETPIDKRNFTRKMLGSNLLIKLDEKEKSSSKKGAFFYKIDKEKHNHFDTYITFFTNPEKNK